MNTGDVLAVARLRQALPVGLSAYAEANSISPVPAPQPVEFQPGQHYQGEILRHLQGNQFLLKIHNQIYQAQLNQSQLNQPLAGQTKGNANPLVGAETSLSSRVGKTFSLEYQGGQATPVFKLLEALSEHPANIKLTLSPAAYQLGQQLQQRPKQTWAFSASTPVLPRIPVAMTAESDAAIRALFVQEIRHAVQNSGLFYESHLAQWVRGSRSLADVMQEPQNQRNHSESLLKLEQTVQTAPTLGQQLAVLERQQLHWQGEIWPTQYMQMQIGVLHREGLHQRPEGSGRDGHELPAESAMVQAMLALDMPHLGSIKVRLAYLEGKLQISMHAIDTASLQHMRLAGYDLSENLKKAGQQLQSLQFNHSTTSDDAQQSADSAL